MPKNKGLPIGNLNSQFFANVYLDAFDQFVKHELKCRHYLHYCDDRVAGGRTREPLLQWRQPIETFLRERLDLELNASRERLRPVSDGVDFLGCIVRRWRFDRERLDLLCAARATAFRWLRGGCICRACWRRGDP